MGPKLSGRGGLFQSTFPRRERPRTYEKPFPVSTYFNPRSREGSDSLVPNRIYCTSSFQSTLPRRERRDWMTARHPSSDFNPRSREGSDRIGVVVVRVEAPISIHAPAKGATIHLLFGRVVPVNFNPRSREGSDPRQEPRPSARPDFNPRSREGSDVALLDVPGPEGNFNPRSREGSD